VTSISQAYSMHIATLLSNEEAKKFYDNIEDILEQADEVDKVYLQVIKYFKSQNKIFF